MKETKVYVDELPEDCTDCPCYDFDVGGCQCQNAHVSNDEINRFNGCPLIDIKTHDKEKDKKIKELEDKIRELQEIDNKRAFRLYAVLYDVLEKQDPENVASRIDYLTGKDYGEMCELYKTAKNLKQHDRELVKEVCDKIKQYFNENLDNCEEYHCCGFNGKNIEDIYGFLENLQKEYDK